MTLNPALYSPGPWAPGVTADVFIPDQLIGGDMKIVTDTALITLLAGMATPYLRGTVLGQVTIGAIGAPALVGAGNGTLTAATAGPKAKAGAYTIKFKSATTFDVVNPNGAQIAEGLQLGAYADPEINFTITAGANAFAAGDTFTLPVAAGSGAYKMATAAAVDGSATPVAILVDVTDPTSGDVFGGVYLMGEFNGNAVILGAGITLAAAKAALAAQNIYLKTPVVASDPS